MRILIFIEVDVVIRHFIHSGAFTRLCALHDVKFIFPELGNKRMSGINPVELSLPSPYEHISTSHVRRFYWKRLYLTDQLSWRTGSAAKAMRKLQRINLGWKASILLGALSQPLIRQIYHYWIKLRLRAIPNITLESLIDLDRPDIIIHPCVLEGLFINDLIEVAKPRNIPLVVVMNSWDNPSTKRAMCGIPDWLLVWGDQTKRHAIEFAGMPADRVVKFGAAQFDAYRALPRLTRSEFCRINKLNPEGPILLYAGSSKGTNEIAHLTLLDQAIMKGELPKLTILYRPHPWGGGGAGGNQLLKQRWVNVVIDQSMLGYLERVENGDNSKFMSDYADVHDVLSNVDAIISPLSTIILEAAMHGKPALCLLPLGDNASHFKCEVEFIHFQEMFNMKEFLIAKGLDQLISRTNELILRAANSLWESRMKECTNSFVEPHSEPFAERIIHFIESVDSTRRIYPD